eukprot:1650760-Amphidinium_carterae.2
MKPDHVAVRLPLQLDRLSPFFRGQAEPQVTEPREVEARYQAARANHTSPHTSSGAEQLKALDAWFQSTPKAAKKRRDGWNQYVKDMWKDSPKKIYKWIRGIAVWDLAVHDVDGFAYTPDDTAKLELGAWSKLRRPGTPQLQKQQGGNASDWEGAMAPSYGFLGRGPEKRQRKRSHQKLEIDG